MSSLDTKNWMDILNLTLNSKRSMEHYYDTLYKNGLAHCLETCDAQGIGSLSELDVHTRIKTQMGVFMREN